MSGALGDVLTSASLLELPVCCNGVPTMHGKLSGTVSPAKPHLTYCTITVPYSGPLVMWSISQFFG